MGSLIKIPYKKQPKGSRKCGAACIYMLIRYYCNKYIPIDDIWRNIIDISSYNRTEYCKTYKMGKYLTSNYLKTCIVQYNDLKTLLLFCNSNGIAPILNHHSFEDVNVGHFTVVKNIFENSVIINDPKNKQRVRVSLSELEELSIKKESNDEIGGKIAIVPILDKFVNSTKSCINCGENVDVSLSNTLNQNGEMIKSDLCLFCDTLN